MKYLHLIGLVFFLSSIQGQTLSNKVNNCKNAKAELKKVTSTRGSNQFEIVTSNMIEPLNYTFYDENHKKFDQRLSMEVIDGLIEGRYYCIVTDAKGCRLQVKSEIKLK